MRTNHRPNQRIDILTVRSQGKGCAAVARQHAFGEVAHSFHAFAAQSEGRDNAALRV
jgi:hypothetical protein